MNIKMLGAFAAVALLAACAKPAATAMSTGAGQTVTSGPAPGSEEDLVANVGDRVFYGFNKTSLSSDATATLSHQAGWLQKFPQVSVLVAGNCDPRGTEEYNLALGQRRADAARDFLVAQGVDGSRIQTISYGKDRPTAQGDDDASYQQNRNAITSVQGHNPQEGTGASS
ncbi:peptidoglycan-associated lipoprotein Pal [Acidisoma silvae]|uniref:Peptidoglycan-associated lipoprotein n=1 Tax=Acidisoma silvae TaxID=2802396 RepID=A0A964DZQ4_9PROT|nr:peptidoglycan-associated lipoprotein Pal [Acidisoma silvae]MCB8876344.1 peptidoglycan-associated lipoprotein Pal [Acidisoma silvae]